MQWAIGKETDILKILQNYYTLEKDYLQAEGYTVTALKPDKVLVSIDGKVLRVLSGNTVTELTMDAFDASFTYEVRGVRLIDETMREGRFTKRKLTAADLK